VSGWWVVGLVNYTDRLGLQEVTDFEGALETRWTRGWLWTTGYARLSL